MGKIAGPHSSTCSIFWNRTQYGCDCGGGTEAKDFTHATPALASIVQKGGAAARVRVTEKDGVEIMYDGSWWPPHILLKNVLPAKPHPFDNLGSLQAAAQKNCDPAKGPVERYGYEAPGIMPVGTLAGNPHPFQAHVPFSYCRVCGLTEDSHHSRDGVALQSVSHPSEQYPDRDHGIKLDDGKPEVDLHFLQQFPEAIKAVARVSKEGTEAPGHVLFGWKTVANGYRRYTEAMGRHKLDTPPGEDPTDEMIGAAAIVAWNAMARLEHLLMTTVTVGLNLDTRPEA